MTPNPTLVASPTLVANPTMARKADAPAASAATARRPAKKATSRRVGRASTAVAQRMFEKLRACHSDAHCELEHQNPFQLIVATVLSAQSTDVMVNKLTPELFRRWPTPQKLAAAEPAQVEDCLKRIGMFRQKTRNVIGLAKKLVEEHHGEVPRTLAELVKLPGVGRKTANVVLGVAFGAPEGVVVDTHVQRISQRLGLTVHTEPIEIEQDLMRLFPASEWDLLSHVLIFHGRRICTAQRPACAACPVQTECPSAFKAELVGRKPARLRVRAVAPVAPLQKPAPRAVKTRKAGARLEKQR
jgi:endonuclease-3